jgi:opacity protein-like surface antigen
MGFFVSTPSQIGPFQCCGILSPNPHYRIEDEMDFVGRPFRRPPPQEEQEKTMKRALAILAVITVCGSLALPASATEKGWHLRVFAAGFDPDLDVIVPAENPDEVRFTADSDLGFGAGLEYQFSERLGLELGVMQASPAVELSADIPDYGHLSLKDPMSTRIITLDLDFHLTPSSQCFDFFLGGGIASVAYDNLHYVDPDGDPLDLAISDDLSYSAKVGLDIALGKNSKWAATGGLRYVWSDIEVRQVEQATNNTATFDFDLFHFTVGVAYSF